MRVLFRGLTAVLLVLACCVASRPAAAADFSPDQRKEIEKIIGEYLAKNPEVLLDALQAAKEKLKSEAHDKASAALVTHKAQVFDDPDAPTAGNPKGDVAIVEFFDYSCPYCKMVEPSLEKLLGEDRQLRIVYKEFPVLGPGSTVAAKAALASRKQGKYDVVHRALMGFKGHLDEAAVFKTIAPLGLDTARLKRDMEAPEVERMLQANIDLADALDINGTPGFVIGNEIIPSAIGIEDMKKLIEAARKK